MKLEVTTKFVDIKTSDGTCDSYAVYPKHQERFKAVILYPDAYGPRPYLYDMANSIAASGYYVLLPNILYRSKRAPLSDAHYPLKRPEAKEALKVVLPMARSLTPEQMVQDARILLYFLFNQSQVLPGRIGITGYCMGGVLALRTAASYPEKIGAIASFHAGHLVTDSSLSPHRLLKEIKAEGYIAHADNDPSMSPEQIELFDRAISESGANIKTEIYKNASHGFVMADLPDFNEQALQKHWTALFELLDRM